MAVCGPADGWPGGQGCGGLLSPAMRFITAGNEQTTSLAQRDCEPQLTAEAGQQRDVKGRGGLAQVASIWPDTSPPIWHVT